ncbi:unnamed protein product [Aphanomyces euteiches]
MYWNSGSEPIEAAAKTRSVYLPVGCDWFDFWTGETFTGGQTIVAKATLDTMPLFILAGSIIPIGPELQYTSEKPDAVIELRIYAGQDGSFSLYEDEGDNYNYEKGAYSSIKINWADESKQLTFEQREGTYPGIQQTKKFAVVLVNVEQGCGLQEAGETAIIVSYVGELLTVSL